MDKIKCDVLIIGGGVGGLSCAISLKERLPDADVLIVEKQVAGYSGKANRGGGVLQWFDYDKVTPEQFAAFHANTIGGGLGDSELMMKYVAMNHDMMNTLTEWGVNVPKKDDGTYNVMPTGPFTAMICVDLDITLRLRRRAEKLGVRFIDKTSLAELSLCGNEISGAVVYSILDGSVSAIQAKRVVLATGSQNYRVGSMWGSGRGDGIAAAYRAGAELRNVEFGNFAQLVRIRSHNEVVFGENFMYNAKGEHVTRNFCKTRETDISSVAIREWYTQNRDGNGPIHLDFGPPMAGGGPNMEKAWDRPYAMKFRALNDGSGAKVDTDMEVCPMLIGEQSPIKVDHGMATTIPGLYAIGDCSYCGSGLAGAVPAPPGRNRGSGILNAVFAALLCAERLASEPMPEAWGEISNAEETEAALNAYLTKADAVDPKKVIYLIQQAMAPVEQSVWMHADRMEKAMEFVNQAKALLPEIGAKDWHGVLTCREAEAAVLSAELHYTVSAMRKESRAWFLREDYPEQDDVNWRKCITVRNEGGKMVFGEDPSRSV